MKTVSVPSAAPALQPPPAALKLMCDERLARWAARGSQPALAVIFERHHQALHRYCHSIVGNGHDAADALQNTMLKALGALPGERRAIALKPWLYRIAHNESISLLRARRSDSNLDAARQIGDLAADAIAESRERLRDLTSDLRELTEQQRGALLMRELGGLTFDDVSGALQITVSAAKQSVYEARCALQSMQEGRAMDCEVIRRSLSDGDRRTLRNVKLRGHLRACAGCRDFEAALRRRPAHLAALTPPLPLAAAASILHGLLGASAGTGAGHGGGGLLAAIGAGAKSVGGTSLATKVATAAVIAGSAGGGAIYAAPDAAPQRAGAAIARDSAAAGSGSIAPNATVRDGARRAALARAENRSADTPETSRTATGLDEEAVGDEAAQRPMTHAVPAPATSTRPRQPAPRAAPAAAGARAGAHGESDDDPPQAVPARAASSAPPRPAQAPESAAIPATAPIPASAPIPAGAPVPASAPAGNDGPASGAPVPAADSGAARRGPR